MGSFGGSVSEGTGDERVSSLGVAGAKREGVLAENVNVWRKATQYMGAGFHQAVLSHMHAAGVSLDQTEELTRAIQLGDRTAILKVYVDVLSRVGQSQLK